MKIHTNTLSANDLYDAMSAAKRLNPGMSPVFVDGVMPGGSRSHSVSLAFRLASTGGPDRKRLRNSGQYGADHTHAATWDDHGHWMAQVYELDTAAVFSHAGGTGQYVVYSDREAFHTATRCAYVPLPAGAKITASVADGSVFYLHGLEGTAGATVHAVSDVLGWAEGQWEHAGGMASALAGGHMTTWANGFGIWHVRVEIGSTPEHSSGAVIAARRALRDEFAAREDITSVHRPIWAQPIRRPDLDEPGSIVYTEGPCADGTRPRPDGLGYTEGS